MQIYVVTYRPFYSDQISIRKAFTTDELAKEYISNEIEKEMKEVGGNKLHVGVYEVEQTELR